MESMMEKMREISQYEVEISKTQGALSDVRRKVQDKNNNPKVLEISDFFKQREMFNVDAINLSVLKKEKFDIEKQIYDQEFENTQLEHKIGKYQKSHQEKLRKLKTQFQEDSGELEDQIEISKMEYEDINDRKLGLKTTNEISTYEQTVERRLKQRAKKISDIDATFSQVRSMQEEIETT